MTTKTVIKDTTAVRLATSEEREAWYAVNGGIDSAGESIVFSGTMYVPMNAGEVVTVLRARCSAQVGWQSVSGYAEVRRASGEVVRLPREAINGQENPAPKVTTGTDAAISMFAVEVQSLINGHYEGGFPRLTAPTITVEWGRKYAKLVKNDAGSSRSVYCFVDRTTGDILKAESWAAPAKHARGSVLAATTEGRLSGVNVYGANYLV